MSDGLPYNGWPELIRHGRDKHYYNARKTGVLTPSAECLGCRCALPINCTPYHTEEYGPSLEAYWKACVPLCSRCHAMLHARFVTPNRWHLYLTQALHGDIDPVEYPQAKVPAPLLSKFKNRKDCANCDMPENAPAYFKTLSMVEYKGINKVATLLVNDLNTGGIVEVPDWTIYGCNLEKMNENERKQFEFLAVDVNAFLSNTINLPRDSKGILKYKKLYS